ncbi:hypothetical protein [Methylocystis hirsuta]|uniref:Uncharacterized protein n=1 Tax=Methylocystis hirsuta TaxID=369798 RepID=A0A3M9XTQ4_9HYPH|nr:hypothetical protein [Methylocystis hirsuta]RNJ51394.1 hypothetical protein D1O30_19120 [Methylocystis hirsuta]
MALSLLKRLWPRTPAISPGQPQKNEHGHLIVKVTGLDLTGAQEVERLRAAGYRIGDYARSCLLSSAPDSYDANHRLVAGREYTIALMPTKEIEDWRERTTANLRKRGIERYGYGVPLSGVVPRIRESVSDTQMEAMGFWFIAAPHDPIKDSDGDPLVLSADRGGDGRWLDARWDLPDIYWRGDGAFAFLVSAS